MRMYIEVPGCPIHPDIALTGAKTIVEIQHIEEYNHHRREPMKE